MNTMLRKHERLIKARKAEIESAKKTAEEMVRNATAQGKAIIVSKQDALRQELENGIAEVIPHYLLSRGAQYVIRLPSERVCPNFYVVANGEASLIEFNNEYRFEFSTGRVDLIQKNKFTDQICSQILESLPATKEISGYGAERFEYLLKDLMQGAGWEAYCESTYIGKKNRYQISLRWAQKRSNRPMRRIKFARLSRPSSRFLEVVGMDRWNNYFV